MSLQPTTEASRKVSTHHSSEKEVPHIGSNFNIPLPLRGQRCTSGNHSGLILNQMRASHHTSASYWRQYSAFLSWWEWCLPHWHSKKECHVSLSNFSWRGPWIVRKLIINNRHFIFLHWNAKQKRVCSAVRESSAHRHWPYAYWLRDQLLTTTSGRIRVTQGNCSLWRGIACQEIHVWNHKGCA